MRPKPHCAPWPNHGGITPLETVAAWPADRRLAVLHSGRTHRRFARWSILASPRATWRFTDHSHWVGPPPEACAGVRFTHDPLADLDAILGATRSDAPSDPDLGFAGGWIGGFSYHLGRVIEPAAAHRPGDDAAWPLIELAWCPDALVFDHLDNTWHQVGSPPLDELRLGASQRAAMGPAGRFSIGPIQALREPGQYMAAVERALRDIAAGDIFQVNLAQHFAAAFSGSARGLFASAMALAQPWYGSYLELASAGAGQPRRCAISLSPELFLQADLASRTVSTRPIKGTRPAADDPAALLGSAKDAAELHMIIDLMRNDLGRICEYGSVRVASARAIESHPTVHHGVGEVAGRLRAGITAGGLLRAAFPPGSVTGAPKIRAMQIIDELEPLPREWYCGCIGCIGDDGRIALNVAIRTLLLEGRAMEPERFDRIDGRIDYAAGAGIVSDSDPQAEHRETLDKAAALRLVAAGSPPEGPAPLIEIPARSGDLELIRAHIHQGR